MRNLLACLILACSGGASVACGSSDSNQGGDKDDDSGTDGSAETGGSGGRAAGAGGRAAGSGGVATGSGGRATGSGGVAAGSGGRQTGSGGELADASVDATADAMGDATVADASADAGDASPLDGAGEAGTVCDYGSAQSVATDQSLNLFGEVVYFGDGATLPPGRYRVTYEDGCMKYASNQAWTIHAYSGGASAAWWLVGETSNDRIAVPPGTVGYYDSNGAYASFADCVAANAALPPVEFEFAGGKLGVWLLDSPYSDNLSGEDGRNPKWKLTLLEPCTDAGADR